MTIMSRVPFLLLTVVEVMALAMILDASPREMSFTKDSIMTITVRMQAWVLISQAQK